MKTLVLQIPDSLEINDVEVKMILSAKLYEQGKLSLGQAAQLVGMKKEAFIVQLANYNVSFFNYDPTEIEKDIQNASHYHF